MSNSENLLHRARMLRERRREEDAIPLLMECLGGDPENAEAHAELALTRLEVKGQRKLALESIDEALRIHADEPFYLALKGFILSRLDRDKDAVKLADQAIALDPALPFAWTVKTSGLIGQSKWAEAEDACKEALALDADDSSASNQLAIILRAQGKLGESELQVASLLDRDAEDPNALATNGWTALQSGRRDEAEEFFCDALRIDPENSYAKSGLKEAYKARSSFYRFYLKWVFFMQRYTEGRQMMIGIGLYIGFRILSNALGANNKTAGMVVLGLWIGIVCWTSLAPAIGNFILLKDQRARLALENWEKRLGLFVGLPFFIGVGILALGAVLFVAKIGAAGGALALGGLILIISCLPGSRVFGNAARAGQIIFACFALLGLLGALIALSRAIVPADPESGLDAISYFGFIGAALSTWLTMIPGLYCQIDPIDS